MQLSIITSGLFLILLASRVAFAQGIIGRVVSSSGEPLAGVTVWNMPEIVTSAADGTFFLRTTPRIVRFQMNGYRPVTKFVDNNATIMMEKAADALWTPPICKLTPEWFRAGTMAFHRPKGARLKHRSDIDYGTSSIPYKKNTLLLGYGLTWSWGYPGTRQFFDGISELRERDIQYRPGVRPGNWRVSVTS